MEIYDSRESMHESIRLGESGKIFPDGVYARITEKHLEEYKASWTNPSWWKSPWHEYCCAWLLIERGEL